MSDNRFDLSAIDRKKDEIEKAKLAARQPADSSNGRLMALANLPWLIAVIAVALWFWSK